MLKSLASGEFRKGLSPVASCACRVKAILGVSAIYWRLIAGRHWWEKRCLRLIEK